MIKRTILGLPRYAKRLIVLCVDLVLLPLAMWVSFSLRLGELYVPKDGIILLFIAVPVIAIPIFIRFGLYRAIIRYIGSRAMWAVVRAVSLYSLIWGVLVLLTAIPHVPRSVLLINCLVTILFIGSSRAIARWWLSGSFESAYSNGQRKKVAIYGAGDAGRQIVAALAENGDFQPVAYIDEKKLLQGHYIQGLPVFGPDKLNHVIEEFMVTDVLLAMPLAPISRRSAIIAMLEHYPVRVKTLPGIGDLANGKIKVDDIRGVGARDLLGRDPVEPDVRLLNANVENKVVLVTGAGGSIGSELCRQIIRIKPKALILYEQNEHALYDTEIELNELVQQVFSSSVNMPDQTIPLLASQTNHNRLNIITPILASVTNQSRLEMVCAAFGVQTIYHAAAYKHVPMVEKNPLEAINNNILGTYRAAMAAINSVVDTFVLVSTDKAVRPTNTMGASKRFAEMILQSLSKKPDCKTRFTMVRFGNVLESSGSVMPLFREQIKNGGPVTVTDPEIIRYFMTTSEAAQLVIQAGAMGRGGDVFVLDMGEPVKILDMAKRMIRLSGFEVKGEDNPDGDIEITFTGLRPGEKLYEELLIGERVIPTLHELILSADETSLPWRQIETYVEQFSEVVENYDVGECRVLLMDAVSEFRPQCKVSDLVFEQNGHIELDTVSNKIQHIR